MSFTKERRLGQPARVRAFTASPSFLLLVLVLVLSPRAHAQEQEDKLVNRLLRPDTTLQNSAQDKKFVAASIAQDRQARTGKFNYQDKTRAKTFAGSRTFAARDFSTHPFYSNRDIPVPAGKTVLKKDLAFGTHTATNLRVATDSNKKAKSQDFAGNRPFLGKGKSQKALSQQNRPLTIDEVRELLNKNK